MVALKGKKEKISVDNLTKQTYAGNLRKNAQIFVIKQ